MKIIQIGDYPQDRNLIKGGVQASIFGLTQSLIKQGNDVTVISMPTRDIKEDIVQKDGNLTTYFFGNKYKYQLLGIFYLNTILALIKRLKADAIHIHATSLLALFLVAALRLKGENVVITVHGIVSVEFWHKLKRGKNITGIIKLIVYFPVEFLYINLSKKIIVDTQYVANTLKRLTFRKIHVIPQGIDETFYHIPDNYIKDNIISIGVIAPRKGYEHSIRAIAKLSDRFPKLRYNIIGILKDENKPYFEELNKVIEKENIRENVTFYTNILFEDLKSQLEKAELFILHSAEESQGIVFCEAMAAGKPIVATNIGGIPFVVKDKVNGFLSGFGDTTSFARHIESLLSDPNLRKQMSEASRKLSQSYNWDHIASEITSSLYR